jgi:ribosome-binding protein aMBF1 (putative translation factor)
MNPQIEPSSVGATSSEYAAPTGLEMISCLAATKLPRLTALKLVMTHALTFVLSPGRGSALSQFWFCEWPSRKSNHRFFKKAAANSPSPWRRVALLGIAQRTIRIKYAQKSRKDPRVKPLPVSIKAIGDWIQVKRREKNLTRCHLALKMGIATVLIQSWEDGTSQPNGQQLEVLSSVLGLNAKLFETLTSHPMNLPCLALENHA